MRRFEREYGRCAAVTCTVLDAMDFAYMIMY